MRVRTMNSKQLQYVLMLSKTRNFSKVADELGISQPALSKQIMGLEKELGVKLFDRDTAPLTLTAAGEFFLEKAKKILSEEELLVKAMEGYKEGDRGKLVIGVPPFRSLYMMPDVVVALKEKFPLLQTVLVEQGISVLGKGLLEGEYDFAIMNLPVDESEFEVFPLEKDELVLAVPNSLRHLACEKDGKIRLADCKNVPFVTVGKEQEMRKLFDKLCTKAGITPRIYAEVTGVNTAWEIVKKGIAATILPRQFVKREAGLYDVTLLGLRGTSNSRQPAIVMRKGQFVSEYAKFAIDILRKK